MNMQPATLKPAQLNALQQHIKNAADHLSSQHTGKGEAEVGSLIYMGNVHDSFPRELIVDPVLNSEEIHTWMLMRLEVSDQHSVTRIPKQDTLMDQLKCSRPIVSRNLQVLRAMRWITLCEVVRGPDGQYRGAIYAQHDEPLSLAETLQLDSGYLGFLKEETKGDVLKRLNHIKQAVLKHTDYRLMTDKDALLPESTLTTSLRQLESKLNNNPLDTVLACPPEAVEPKNQINCYESSAIPDEIKAVLRRDENEIHHVKDFYAVESNKIDPAFEQKHINQPVTGETPHVNKIDVDGHVKNIDTAYCSSGSNYSNNINTTTTPKLRLPKCFAWTDKTVSFALDLAKKLPIEQQQYALNYVEDAYLAGQQGISKEIKNPIGYLRTLVEDILNDTLGPSSYGFREPKGDGSSGAVKPNNRVVELKAEINHLDKMISLSDEPSTKQALTDQRNQMESELSSYG